MDRKMVVQTHRSRAFSEVSRRALLVLAGELRRRERPDLAQGLEDWLIVWDGSLSGQDALWDVLRGLEAQVIAVLSEEVRL